MQDECTISANDLACQRGDRLLFCGLSLALKAGDSLHITGANGIGKTSLIRILAGLDRPLIGTVARSAMAGLASQHNALDPEIALGRALSFWAMLDGQPALSADAPSESLTRLGLAGLLDVPVRYLSTGQQKRAGLARLAAQNAPIWLLDEPLNGLDDEGVTIAETMIAEHCDKGGLAVVASHQPIRLPSPAQLALMDFQP